MKNKLLQVLALSLIAGSLFGTSSVHAASNALGITPRKDYSIEAGQNKTDTLYINNLSATQDLVVTFKVIDFGAKDESGTPALNLQENATPTPWSLKPFLKLPKSVTVAPGKTALVPITINIPAGQGAGSYYSAVQYLAQNVADQKRLNLAASSVSLLFANVPGEAKENLSLLQFGAYTSNPDGQSGGFGSVFIGSEPKELAYRIRNNGNVAEQLAGAASIKNMFGKQVVEIKDVNPKKQLALRGQIRRISFCIKAEEQNQKDANGKQQSNIACKKQGLMPGRYTAQFNTFYGLPGSSQQEILASASFWYLPWWFLVVLLVVVAIIVYGVMWVYRKVTGNSSSRRRR